ncbi:hypothetical protein WSM22_13990 [Cytophagales bacterium WSM2-2]|nr:hypothetical protein WSM22_13990 [Cytophagales bacterium WSM2-2]
MKIRIILGLLFIANLCFGQSGNYYLSHYMPDDERLDYFTFSIVQDDKGVTYFANRKGIIEFDGRNWGLINGSGPVFTMATSGREIFAGGFNGFGKLTIGSDQVKTYQSLSADQPKATQIFSSLSLNGKIYFANAQSIFSLSASTAKVEAIIPATDQQEFNGLMEIAGKAYVKSTKGIFKIEDNKLVPPAFPWTDNLSIEFSASSQSLTLLGVTGGRLFLASVSGLKEINIVNKDVLTQSVAISGAWIGEGLVAIGTLRGGVIFIDPQTGIQQEATNFYTGLPSNEVLAMLPDRNLGLWVAHDYGFTRIAPLIPFKSYSHYTGLAGNLLCAKTYAGQLYVGTSLGLFCLEKQEMTEDIFVSEQATSRDTKAKKSMFSFLNRKKVTDAGKATKRTVKSTKYVYKKVDGIEGKVTQLIETDNQLLASGNFGLASIKGTKSSFIVQTGIRAVYKSKALNQLFVSTSEDDIKSYVANPKGWQETKLLDTLNDYVSYMFEDKLQNIWLCGRVNAIKVETVDGEITSVEKIPFSNPTIDESAGQAFGSEVYIATGGSFHRFDLKDNTFKKYDSLPGPKKYFASAGSFWFHDGHRWRTVDPRTQASLKLEWLALFSNLRYIAPADDGLWVITADNELYKFSGKQAEQSQKEYPLFLREVRGRQSKLAPARSIIVSQLESTVTFDFIQPDYLGMKAVEYRYQVKGRSSDWTPWSTSNNVVNFSYLPSGKYKLDIQTRDLMGKISAVEEITLVVEPPYWKRSWFYLLEVIFFGSMVVLSIRLSAGNQKYRVISQLLSMLTVIMIIQLLQAAVNGFVTVTASPVIDFFVQVGMALLVLPVEAILRNFMAKEAAKRTSTNQDVISN